MEMLILTLLLPAFWWLMIETDYMRVRLAIGIIPEPFDLQPQIDTMYREWIIANFLERISWDSCLSRNPNFRLSPGVKQPLCGWAWLKNNTHPIPQVIVDFSSGGVRYHWDIKDCTILKDAITATHAKPKSGNGQLHFKRNKLGGLVAPLPPKIK